MICRKHHYKAFVSRKIIWHWKKESQTPFTNYILNLHTSENTGIELKMKIITVKDHWINTLPLLRSELNNIWVCLLTGVYSPFLCWLCGCNVSIPTRATPFKRKRSISADCWRRLHSVQILLKCVLGKKGARLLMSVFVIKLIKLQKGVLLNSMATWVEKSSCVSLDLPSWSERLHPGIRSTASECCFSYCVKYRQKSYNRVSLKVQPALWKTKQHFAKQSSNKSCARSLLIYDRAAGGYSGVSECYTATSRSLA